MAVGSGVGVGMAVGMGVGVGVGVAVGSGVGVCVGSGVNVGVGAGVLVGSGISVGGGVSVGAGVSVGNGVAVGMGEVGTGVGRMLPGRGAISKHPAINGITTKRAKIVQSRRTESDVALTVRFTIRPPLSAIWKVPSSLEFKPFCYTRRDQCVDFRTDCRADFARAKDERHLILALWICVCCD